MRAANRTSDEADWAHDGERRAQTHLVSIANRMAIAGLAFLALAFARR